MGLGTYLVRLFDVFDAVRGFGELCYVFGRDERSVSVSLSSFLGDADGQQSLGSYDVGTVFNCR